jgi:hypothetical protein
LRPGDRHAAADDAGGEVVDEHLEPRPRLSLDEPVEELQEVCRERTDDHRTEGEHRYVGADDQAHGRDGADHRAALAVHESAAGITIPAR